MKLPWEKKHICMAILLFAAFAASVLFYTILQRWSIVSKGFMLVFDSLRPVTYGLILAYLLNPMMNVIERNVVTPVFKKLFKSKNGEHFGRKRTVAIVITWLIVCVFISALVSLVAPEIIKSVETLVAKSSEYTLHVREWIEELPKRSPVFIEFTEHLLSGIADNVRGLAEKVLDIIPNIDVLFVGVSSSLYNMVTLVINIFIGVIVSVYVLKDKEKFIAQSKKITYSILSVKRANSLSEMVRLTHSKFGSFITGKIFDSIIIGILCFIILSIFNMPYTALVSVVVGVTNVIPFFGPFIGAIPSAFLILCEDPAKCLTFIIIILLLQQFDGNILGPKILGSSTGMSSFWVLTTILVGSGLFGLWGMVCAVPLFAVFYTQMSSFCRKRLKQKGIDYSTEAFEKIDVFDEKTNAPKWK